MHRTDDKVDFEVLETELQNAIQEDFKYWRENNAKFRAINQRVSSYDEFRELVKGANLKALEKCDKLSADGVKQKGCIWNNLVHKENEWCLHTYKETKDDDIGPSLHKATKYENSTNTLQLLNGFVLLTMEKKLELLKLVGRGEVNFTEIEIPTGVLGNIVETLMDVTESHNDSINVTNIIEVLATSKRFNLSLDFLTVEEKKNFTELIQTLQLESILPDQWN